MRFFSVLKIYTIIVILYCVSCTVYRKCILMNKHCSSLSSSDFSVHESKYKVGH